MSGIGYAVAEGAIESNARVTISSSSSTKVESAIASLKKSYPTATTTGHPCDLSKPTVELDLETLFSKVKDINHIVVTAGDAHTTGPISSITYDSILATGQVRFIAALLMPKSVPNT
jgi:short-subunit dehydrogenase